MSKGKSPMEMVRVLADQVDSICEEIGLSRAALEDGARASEILDAVRAQVSRKSEPLPRSEIASLFKDEGGEREDRLSLGVDFVVGRVHGVDDRVEIRLDSDDEVVTLRAFQDGHPIGGCSVPVGESLLVSFAHLSERSENVVGRRHEDSLAGYGADPTAPMASGEAATSPDGDTVRDATDTSSPPPAGRAG